MIERVVSSCLVTLLCAVAAGCSLGGDPTPALTSLEPAVSPDGHRLAYETAVNQRLKLFVRDLASGTSEQVTDGTSDDFSPAWSPDGTSIVFASNREKGNVDLYTLDLSRREVRRLTNDPGNDMYPAWAADGRIYFNSDRTKAWQVYSILPDGSGLTAVVAQPAP